MQKTGVAIVVSILICFQTTALFGGNEPYACKMVQQIKIQMNVASDNLENAETTRSREGGPYKRKIVYCSDAGCEITAIPGSRMVYNPSHPDADNDGMVAFPKVDPNAEMSAITGLQHSLEWAQAECKKRN